MKIKHSPLILLFSLLICWAEPLMAGEVNKPKADDGSAAVFAPLRNWWYDGAKRPNPNSTEAKAIETYFSAHPDDRDALWWAAVAQEQQLIETGHSDLELIESAAAQGQTAAMAWLGRNYVTGKAVPLNTQKGLELLIRARDAGEPDGALELGKIYLHGAPEVEPDLAKAEIHLQQALTLGTIYAHYFMIDLYQRQGDNAKALDSLKRGAQAGDPAAMEGLAISHRDGKLGLEVDSTSAIRWMHAAAEYGRPSMQRELAKAILSGYGRLERDEPAALMLLELASRAKDPEAMGLYGYVMVVGDIGAQIDVHKGVDLIEASIAAGDPTAMFNLGRLYIEGISIPRDLNRAEALLEQAAKNKHEPAQRLLQRLTSPASSRPTTMIVAD